MNSANIQHILAEFVQIGGAIGSFAALAGSINPIAGAACALLASAATILKPLIVQNVVTATPGVTVTTKTS